MLKKLDNVKLEDSKNIVSIKHYLTPNLQVTLENDIEETRACIRFENFDDEKCSKLEEIISGVEGFQLIGSNKQGYELMFSSNDNNFSKIKDNLISKFSAMRNLDKEQKFNLEPLIDFFKKARLIDFKRDNNSVFYDDNQFFKIIPEAGLKNIPLIPKYGIIDKKNSIFCDLLDLDLRLENNGFRDIKESYDGFNLSYEQVESLIDECNNYFVRALCFFNEEVDLKKNPNEINNTVLAYQDFERSLRIIEYVHDLKSRKGILNKDGIDEYCPIDNCKISMIYANAIRHRAVTASEIFSFVSSRKKADYSAAMRCLENGIDEIGILYDYILDDLEEYEEDDFFNDDDENNYNPEQQDYEKDIFDQTLEFLTKCSKELSEKYDSFRSNLGIDLRIYEKDLYLKLLNERNATTSEEIEEIKREYQDKGFRYLIENVKEFQDYITEESIEEIRFFERLDWLSMNIEDLENRIEQNMAYEMILNNRIEELFDADNDVKDYRGEMYRLNRSINLTKDQIEKYQRKIEEYGKLISKVDRQYAKMFKDADFLSFKEQNFMFKIRWVKQ
ncbi:hypothetical protein KY334_07885 [Candidatus Woesearchaeota archaeon]|nr:hypothetical protein [Candidatus Woesearchaeota archaeon]